MAVYAILNRNPDQDLGTLVKGVFSDAYVWSREVAFVRELASAQDVAIRLGVPPPGESEGLTQIIVIEASPNYWGFTGTDFWAWLKAAYEAK
jgi:hypothetical protein